MDTTFREACADPRTVALPLAHLSLELGHLYMDDFKAGPERLREQFSLVGAWAQAARQACAAQLGRHPRISTCFLIDDYFTRFSSPAEVVPQILQEAAAAGLVIDYLARESACSEAGAVQPAKLVEARLVPSPPPGSNGSRPPVTATGWLSNGERSPAGDNMVSVRVPGWQPPWEIEARRHSVFLDVELWDEQQGMRTWSCAFLAAVWQLLRLGLLRNEEGQEVLRPERATGALPDSWEALPPLLQLTDGAAPFAAYRTVSVLASRFLPIEHAVKVVLGQWLPEETVLRQLVERARQEGVSLPGDVRERVGYVFHGPS